MHHPFGSDFVRGRDTTRTPWTQNLDFPLNRTSSVLLNRQEFGVCETWECTHWSTEPSMKEQKHWECLGHKRNVTYRWATLSPLRGGRMFPEPIRQLCTMARHCCTSSLQQGGKPGYLSVNCLQIPQWQTTSFFVKVYGSFFFDCTSSKHRRKHCRNQAGYFWDT